MDKLEKIDLVRTDDTVPAYKYEAARAVLRERERELLELKGPCSSTACTLHYAHAGPCNMNNLPKQA